MDAHDLWKAWIVGMVGLGLLSLSLYGPTVPPEEQVAFARSHYPFPPGR